MSYELRTPETYTPEQIAEMVETTAKLHEGRWVPCRPESWGGISLGRRFKAAWAAFTGEVDVVKWP